MPAFPGLVGASYKSRSPIADCEETWNWYVEPIESQFGKSPAVLYPAPGFVKFSTFAETPIRGVWAENNRLLAVVADKLYDIAADGSAKLRPPVPVLSPSAPQVAISTPTRPLSQMNPPVIYANGVTGTTTYGYKVTAINGLGETNASNEGTTTLGNAQLSSANYCLVTWNLVPHATGYKVYRTTGGAGVPRLLATIANPAQTVFQDDGNPGDSGTPPATNTTGSPTPNTTWGYKIVATNFNGRTLPSVEGTVVGYPVLKTDVHYNDITWTPIPNCTGYEVYRTTAPAIAAPTDDPSKVATVANQLVLVAKLTGNDQTEFVDDGVLPNVDDPLPLLPTTNTTLSTGFPGSPELVSISSSGDAGREVFICAGGQGFIFDLDTNSLTEVVDNAAQGGFIDGYFVALDTASSTLKMSNYLDGLVWDPTQIAQRNVAGDKWQSMIVANREIWLFGEKTSEVWVNAGNSPFPFAPNTNVFIEVGSGALWTAVRVSGQLIWFGQGADGSGLVFQANGYTPDRISDHAFEAAVQRYTFTQDAEAFGYQQDGHAFYVLTFPSANASWVYDLSTKQWSNRGSWNALKNRYEAYRPNCHAYYPQKNLHLVGDRVGFGDQGSILFSMRPHYGHEMDGGIIRRMRRAPHLHADQVRIAYRGLQVDLEVGLARSGYAADDPLLTEPFADNPTLMLRWSDDGGKTWSHEHWMSAGQIGKYRTRAYWSRMGASRDRVYELVCTDPVPWRVIDATLHVEQARF